MEETAAARKFNEIYDKTNRKTLIFITAKCSNPSDISDIFQETYTEIFSVIKKRGIDYIINPEAFVLNTAKQKIYRHYALIQRLGKLSRKEKAPDGGGEIRYTEPAEFSVDDSLVTRDLLHQINDFLKKKPAETRKIFYLHYVLGLTIVQVADELGMTESGVKSRLYRTVNELKEEVKK